MRPPSVGYKFDSDGNALPFPGNTVIFPVDPASRLYTVLLQVHEDLKKRSYTRKIALLPPASYHVTIFNGADDRHRQPPLWPAGLPGTVSMWECHDHIERCLSGVSFNCALPLRLSIAPRDPEEMLRTLRLELNPLDNIEDDKLRHLRDRLASATGIRSPLHKQYRFHLSLAYVIDWFDALEQKSYAEDYAQWKCDIETAAPVIELGNPEYCTFETMLRFNRRQFLERSPAL
jgi:hypothetical protein